MLSRSESTIFRRTVQNFSTKFLQLRSKRYLLCLGSLMFDLFSEDFPQLQTNKPNLKHLSPLVSHLNFYSCGIFHIKGEVGKGLKNLSSTNHFFSAHPPKPFVGGGHQLSNLVATTHKSEIHTIRQIPQTVFNTCSAKHMVLTLRARRKQAAFDP